MKTFAHMELLLAEYARDLRLKQGRQPNTVARYVQTLERFRAFVADDELPLEKASLEQLTTFATREVNGREPSQSTFNTRVAALRSFFGYCFHKEYVYTDPSQRLRRRKQKSQERMPLTFDEALRVVDVIKEHARDSQRDRDVAIFTLFIHSALRVSEAMSLDVSQVDFENRLLRDVRIKGGKGMAVFFSDLVSESLERAIRTRTLLNPAEDEEALFLSQRGTRLSVRTAQQLVTKYGKLAGIKNPVSPHVLRHSSVSALAAIGTPIEVIQEVCGHESIVTTRRYLHIAGTKRRDAADALSDEWKRRQKSLR